MRTIPRAWLRAVCPRDELWAARIAGSCLRVAPSFGSKEPVTFIRLKERPSTPAATRRIGWPLRTLLMAGSPTSRRTTHRPSMLPSGVLSGSSAPRRVELVDYADSLPAVGDLAPGTRSVLVGLVGPTTSGLVAAAMNPVSPPEHRLGAVPHPA